MAIPLTLEDLIALTVKSGKKFAPPTYTRLPPSSWLPPDAITHICPAAQVGFDICGGTGIGVIDVAAAKYGLDQITALVRGYDNQLLTGDKTEELQEWYVLGVKAREYYLNVQEKENESAASRTS